MGMKLPSTPHKPMTMANDMAMPTNGKESPKVTWAKPQTRPNPAAGAKTRHGVFA